MISNVKCSKYDTEEKVYIKVSLMFSGILVEAVSRIGWGKQESKPNYGAQESLENDFWEAWRKRVRGWTLKRVCVVMTTGYY